MKTRRTFLGMIGAAVAFALLPLRRTGAAPKAMKHLFSNDDGELVAANTIEQAWQYHDCELGGYDEQQGDWYQVADGARIPIFYEDENKTYTQTALEWAAEFSEPGIAGSTYW